MVVCVWGVSHDWSSRVYLSTSVVRETSTDFSHASVDGETGVSSPNTPTDRPASTDGSRRTERVAA